MHSIPNKKVIKGDWIDTANNSRAGHAELVALCTFPLAINKRSSHMWNSCEEGWWMEVTIVLFPSMARCLSVSNRFRALLLSRPEVGSCVCV